MKGAQRPDEREQALMIRPRRREENLVVTEFEDEVVVYDEMTYKVNCLSKTSAFVWNHCDGQVTVAGLVALVQDEIDRSLGEDVVWLALRQLDEADLLTERVSLPAEKSRYTRRSVLKSGAAIAGGAVLLPVIGNIVAPDRAHAASFVLNCGNPCSTDADCNVPGATCPSCDPTLLTCV